MNHSSCDHPSISPLRIHMRGDHLSVTNKQRFRCQHTNPSQHLYSTKLGMFLEDVCVHSLSNRPEWLLFLFCQINRHFPDSKCDFFSSQTAHFLGISPGRSIHYQILQVCQNFNSPNSECMWPGLEFMIKVKVHTEIMARLENKWRCENGHYVRATLRCGLNFQKVQEVMMLRRSMKMSKQRNLNGWLWFHGHSVPRST